MADVPCGRYLFTAIDSNSSLDITLTGRTVIAVAGDVQNVGAFHITLGPEAELDLFIAGNASPLVVHYGHAILDLDGCDDPARAAATAMIAPTRPRRAPRTGRAARAWSTTSDAGICKAIIPQ
ncbi:hypothetical protein [Nannocystis radixulma]|uniref:Uncharacterized protein n=1 Tax=Nannocystis radixulma TaxID=2995305 RepID=A0ABT5AZE3_9BACT|nr:hypothetical protein [Nannocystis radixulma]MDC0667205.1 hypothetical protein [Nannocystis radixulma]